MANRNNPKAKLTRFTGYDKPKPDDPRGNPKGVGRPIGTTGPREERNVVQVLKPTHDRIIMLHLANYSNIEIADATGFTPEYVGQILLDPKSVEIISAGRSHIKSNLLGAIDDGLVVLARQSIENLKKTVMADVPLRSPFKRHQDKVGLELLKNLGYGGVNGVVNSPNGSSNGPAAPSISQESVDRLSRALERSDRVGNIEITSNLSGSRTEEVGKIISVETTVKKTGTDDR